MIRTQKVHQLKTWAKIAIILSSVVAIFLVCCGGLFLYYYNSTHLNVATIVENNLGVQILDNNQIPSDYIINSGRKIVNIKSLPKYVSNAFVSIEDKRFFSHAGVEPTRMIKAMLVNLQQKSKVQGASTITQQLIKNTLLTNEKTYDRKLKEISLALKLERELSKERILEEYLNTIYFGENCYGIENASRYYFDKPASLITLDEAAILAGMIKAPNNYSPTLQYDACIKRRNVVLGEMLKEKNISQQEYIGATAIKTIIKQGASNTNAYLNLTYNEACDILGTTKKELAKKGYVIETYLDPIKQNYLENIDYIPAEYKDTINSIQMIVNNADSSIVAYLGRANFDISDMRRQPASTIKPLLVYAPALEENIITPATPILDEALNMDGYAPKNHNGQFLGWTNIRTSLEKSLNIPAIKTLSYLTLDKAKAYADKMNIELSPKDMNMSLALGSMSDGIKISTLVDGYATLARGGSHLKSSTIKRIKDKTGVTIYERKLKSREVFNKSTSYLVTDMLRPNTSSPTTRTLNTLGIDVASKTGTATYKANTTDFYNISYTSEHTVASWLGVIDNGCSFPPDMSSSVIATRMSKDVMSKIYNTTTPIPFNKPNDIVQIKLNKDIYNKTHTLKAAKSEEDYFEEIFAKNYLPFGQDIAIDSNIDVIDSPITLSPPIVKSKKRWWDI